MSRHTHYCSACRLLIESFRFQDENEIFPILSSARPRTNAILAGKCDSHRHTTSFRENVVVTKTSYQLLEILLFNDRERDKTEISVLNVVLVFVLVPESKAL